MPKKNPVTTEKKSFRQFSGIRTEAEANEMMKIIKGICGKTDAGGYDPEFVNKISVGDKDLKAGKGKKITIEELNNLCK